MVRIKICCISNIEEASMAAKAGADALGFVSSMPSGPGVIDEKQIKNIIAGVGPFINSVLLTSKTKAEHIRDQCLFCRSNAIQLCAPVSQTTLLRLKKWLPGVDLIRVIHVTGPEAITEALRFEPLVDAFLLDTGQRSGPDKQLGGTGRTHDWSLSAEIAYAVKNPVILAGGLHAGNVSEAILSVRPYAVDVCSGVRSSDRLDEKKLSDFINACSLPAHLSRN